MTSIPADSFIESRFQHRIADIVAQRTGNPARSKRRNVSRTLEGAAPTRTAIDLWPRPSSIRISESRGNAASLISPLVLRSFLSGNRKVECLTSRTPRRTAQSAGGFELVTSTLTTLNEGAR